VPPRGGEKEFTPYERAWIRPTLEINGIYGGYTGNGFKTVIPSKAFAKVSCRLVAGQDPATVGHLVKNYLESNAPKGTQVKVHLHQGMGLPMKSKFNSALTQAILKSYKEVLGQEIVFTFEGGSIPISSQLAQAAEAEIAFMGLSLPSDLIHAPNEHFDVDRIKQGFCIIGHMIDHLGANR
jgi:acetylornithine deacetylase/succinyl-diaminopimelate desuccinylase-like protein